MGLIIFGKIACAVSCVGGVTILAVKYIPKSNKNLSDEASLQDDNVYLYATGNKMRTKSGVELQNFNCQFNSIKGILQPFDCTVEKVQDNSKKQHKVSQIEKENRKITDIDLHNDNFLFQIKFNAKDNLDKLSKAGGHVLIMKKPALPVLRGEENEIGRLIISFVKYKGKTMLRRNPVKFIVKAPDVTNKVSTVELQKDENGKFIPKLFDCSIGNKTQKCYITPFANQTFWNNHANYSNLTFSRPDFKKETFVNSGNSYLIELIENHLPRPKVVDHESIYVSKTHEKISAQIDGKTINFDNIVPAFIPKDHDHIFIL